MSENKITREQIEQARNANLAEYFQRGGYECELKYDELHVHGYGGLFVNVKTNEWCCFSKNGNIGGTNALNCLTEIIGLDFKTAVAELAGESYSYSVSYKKPVYQPPKTKSFEMPERDGDMRKVFAYLCQTRKISGEIVSALAHDGLLYQDKKGNAVFVHLDDNGEIVGAEIQGTNSFTRFKGVASGTADSLFTVKLGTPNKAYIFESAIDLLSFRQLARQDVINNSYLVSMAGLKPNTLKNLAGKGIKLYSCVDNDDAGIRFNFDNHLTPCGRILQENGVKDYNELLQKVLQPKAEIEKNIPKKVSHARR